MNPIVFNEGRLLKVNEVVYTPASRISAVVKNIDDKTTDIYRFTYDGNVEIDKIAGSFKRIANKVSRAKTTKGGAINLIPFKTRAIDFIKTLIKK